MATIYLKILSFLFFSSSLLAQGYEGHYKVDKPEHKVDIKELENMSKDMNKSSKAKEDFYKGLSEEELERLLEKGGLSREDKKMIEEILRKRREKEDELRNKRLSKEKRERRAKEEKERRRLEELERRRLEELARLRREEELKRQRELALRNSLIKEKRENMIYGINESKGFKGIKRAKEFEGFDRNESGLPVDARRIITSDMYIIGLLENSIDTQLAGRAVIVVEDDVYANEGRKILLPKGSRIVCNYSPIEEGGSTRVPMECNRIYRADNVTIALEQLLVGDQMGKTGMLGDVDNRVQEKYGGALAMAGISGLSSYGSFLLASSENVKVAAASPTLLQTNETLTDVTAKVLEQALDLTPIITVAKGTRVVLMPQVDIYFKEISKGD